MTILKFPRGRNDHRLQERDHPPCLCESCLNAAYLAMGEEDGGYQSDPPRNAREWANWEARVKRREETGERSSGR
jgi:hypothetical protein